MTRGVRGPKFCTIDGCDRASAKRTWCNMHYKRWLRHGDPAWVPPPKALCSVTDCGGQAKAKGYCQRHYSSLRDHGDPLKARPRFIPPESCTLDGCDKPYKAQGYCNAHYRLWLKWGTPHGVKKKIPPEPGLKWCNNCQQFLSVGSFGKSSKKDGLAVYCRPCVRERKRLADPDGSKQRAIARRWQRENQDRFRAYHREYKRREYEANADRVKARQADWRRRNPESTKATDAAKRAKRRAAPVIPFTPAQLAARLAYFGNRCWICGGGADSIDHVKPLSKGGAHALCNIRPACQSCNSRKGARWPL